MTRPLVSVVIPSFNYAKYLPKSLDSVLGQTYRPLEIIVVDDASTDNSLTIINKYQNRHRFIRLVKHSHRLGLSAARNTGLQHSSGQFVAFLDSDDWWHKDKIKLQLQKFDDPRVGLVYSHTNVFDQKKGRIIKRDLAQVKGQVFGSLCSGNKLKGSGSGVLTKKEAFNKCGWFKTFLTSCEDWDQWLRISTQFQTDFVPRPLVTIRQHHSGMQGRQLRMIVNTLIVMSLIPWYIVKFKIVVNREIIREYLKGWLRCFHLINMYFSSPIW